MLIGSIQHLKLHELQYVLAVNPEDDEIPRNYCRGVTGENLPEPPSAGVVVRLVDAAITARESAPSRVRFFSSASGDMMEGSTVVNTSAPTMGGESLVLKFVASRMSLEEDVSGGTVRVYCLLPTANTTAANASGMTSGALPTSPEMAGQSSSVANASLGSVGPASLTPTKGTTFPEDLYPTTPPAGTSEGRPSSLQASKSPQQTKVSAPAPIPPDSLLFGYLLAVVPVATLNDLCPEMEFTVSVKLALCQTFQLFCRFTPLLFEDAAQEINKDIPVSQAVFGQGGVGGSLLRGSGLLGMGAGSAGLYGSPVDIVQSRTGLSESLDSVGALYRFPSPGSTTLNVPGLRLNLALHGPQRGAAISLSPPHLLQSLHVTQLPNQGHDRSGWSIERAFAAAFNDSASATTSFCCIDGTQLLRFFTRFFPGASASRGSGSASTAGSGGEGAASSLDAAERRLSRFLEDLRRIAEPSRTSTSSTVDVGPLIDSLLGDAKFLIQASLIPNTAVWLLIEPLDEEGGDDDEDDFDDSNEGAGSPSQRTSSAEGIQLQCSLVSNHWEALPLFEAMCFGSPSTSSV